jgi:hypothetical protein
VGGLLACIMVATPFYLFYTSFSAGGAFADVAWQPARVVCDMRGVTQDGMRSAAPVVRHTAAR